MSDDGEYIARGDLVVDKKNLSTIPLPPDDVMKSAFLTAIKYRTVKSALRAYDSCVQELVSIKESQASFNRAQLEESRTIMMLEDADKIHQMDSDIRDANALRASETLEQLKHEAYLAEKERHVERYNVNAQHSELMNQTIEKPETTSQADKEKKEWMEAQLFKNSREQQIADEIRKEHNLSDEEEARLAELVAKLSSNPVD